VLAAAAPDQQHLHHVTLRLLRQAETCIALGPRSALITTRKER
jgi:hypothetical protein